jgi:hypothetical protein
MDERPTRRIESHHTRFGWDELADSGKKSGAHMPMRVPHKWSDILNRMTDLAAEHE